MKISFSFISAFVLLLVPSFSLAANFTDVPVNAWFAPHVEAVSKGGMMQGYRDSAGKLTGKFGPGDPVTRAQFLKMVAVMMVNRYEFDRNVIPTGQQWYDRYRDVIQAKDPQLPDIMPIDDVELSQPIQRFEAAGLLVLALGHYAQPIVQAGYPSFSDVTIDTPHSQAIAELEYYKVLSGDETTQEFHPYRTLNRAEAAKMLAMTANSYQIPLGAQLESLSSASSSVVLSQEEQACLSQGGVWKSWGLFPEPFCNIPYADGGKTCTDADDCLGDCLSSEKDAISGKCSSWEKYFGCFGTLQDGKVGGILCRD